jgi:hypothetical protein
MISANDVIQNMVEIKPLGDSDGFRKIKETLSRMGVPSKSEKVLNQSAHILHRRGQYYICHFKELFSLDGLRTDLSESDISRRNRIVKMLVDWGLVEVVNPEKLEPMGHPNTVKVIKYTEKDEWELRTKYSIGVKKTRPEHQ